MESLESKKLALLRTLQILRHHSDFQHPLTQKELLALLELEYGIVLERKAVGRNISLLQEAGYAIENGRKGCYLDEREFEDAELRMLIDGVLCSRYITERHSRDLIDKLCGMSNKYFRSHVKNIHSVGEWSKTENQALFFNIELIDDAINSGKRLEFDYNKYGIDKKLHRTKTHVVSPYQLLLHNQRYYLMARSERWKNITYLRVDHITNMRILEEPLTPLNENDGFEHGISYSELATSLPYMFTDKPQLVEFLADEGIVDQVVDWFGDNARMSAEDGRVQVTVRVSLQAMEYWAMQYLNRVEILSPPSLRQTIAANLQNALKKYQDA